MIKQHLSRLFTALAFSSVIFAAPESQADNLTVDHLMQVKNVRNLTISPEGDWVAYTVRRIDEDKDKQFTQIFMSAVDGSETIAMTADYANASSPQWSPDGKYLSFLGKRGEGDDLESQVWLLDRRGGEAKPYTDVKQGIEGYQWSPDSSKMLLLIKDPKEKDEGPDSDKDSDKPEPYVIDRLQFKADYVGYLDRRRTHIYLFNGEDDPVKVTSGDYDHEDPQWSPDGRHIAFVSKRDGDPDANQNSDIWKIRADMSAKSWPVTQITTNKGPDYDPVWSPDGKSIAYITATRPERLWYDTEHLAVISASGGTPKILTETYDRMISKPHFATDGAHILATAQDGGNRPLIKFSVADGSRQIMTPGDAAVMDHDHHSSGLSAMIRSTHDAPYDVHVLQNGALRQIADHHKGLFDDIDLARVERLTVPGWKGEPVESFVYYPPGYRSGRKYPTIFHLHGGPVSQHDAGFDQWGQLYASQGYIAVLPNPHGSSGYGHDFTYALNRQWGVPDFADVDAIADYLVAEGISDPDELGVGGWSYGGILTNYVITKSERFAAAVTGASEVNHRANYGHDIYQNQWEVELGLPWEDIDAWESMNPFNDIGKITTPTLVIGGQVDWNVPIMNSEQLYQALKRRGIETLLVVYPDEHHGIRRPSFIRDKYDRYVNWYDKYID